MRPGSPTTTSVTTVVFIHGAFMSAESWGPWRQRFEARGYKCVAPAWPFLDHSVGDLQRAPDPRFGKLGITEIVDNYASIIREFETPPVLVGHSFGGLLVQNLLGRDLAAAAIAIDPAPIKGVPELPLSALKSTSPVLGNPFNFRRAVSLTEQQFRFGFTNAVPEQEARELYAKYAMPAPGRPLFQAATATFNPQSATTVNVTNATRGPLLLISGAEDNTVPPVLVKSTLKAYQKSMAVTELKEFAGRGHSLTIDSGWREIAEYILTWLHTKGL